MGSRAKVEKIIFMLVNAPTSYNVILGRTALNRLRATVLTTHLLGVICVDLRVARKCYDESIRVTNGRHRACTGLEEARVHLLKMDHWFDQEDKRPCPGEDLKEVQVGLETHKKIKIRACTGRSSALPAN
ncbi:hypothetical protein CR513_26380, partial [Mucuna pruriens]